MGQHPKGEVVTHEDGTLSKEYLSPAIGHLWPHHRKMARMLVSGQTLSEIATILGFSKGQLSRIMASPAFQAELLRLQDEADEMAVDVHEEIQRIAARAVEVLDANINMDAQTDKQRSLQQNAAESILDRAGYGKKETHINKNLNVNTSLKEIKAMSTEQLRDDIADLIEVD